MAAEQPEKKGRKRRSSSRTPKGRTDFKVPLIIAIVLGLLATLVIIGSQGEPEETKTFAVRAARDITAWTELTPLDVEAVQINLENLFPEGSFRQPSEELFIAGTPEEAVALMLLEDGIYTRLSLRAGELVFKSKLAHGSLIEQTLEDIDITADDRIISLEAMPASAAGGAIKPGDRVDIIVADTAYEMARVLIEDVPVLYVDLSESALESLYSQQIQNPQLSAEDLTPADPFPGIYTLAIPGDRADEVALFATRTQSALVLALRHEAASERDLEEGEEPLEARTISVLEVLCPTHLMPQTLDGEGIGEGPIEAPDVEETPTVELPESCVREIVRLRQDITQSTTSGLGGPSAPFDNLQPIPAGLAEGEG